MGKNENVRKTVYFSLKDFNKQAAIRTGISRKDLVLIARGRKVYCAAWFGRYRQGEIISTDEVTGGKLLSECTVQEPFLIGPHAIEYLFRIHSVPYGGIDASRLEKTLPDQFIAEAEAVMHKEYDRYMKLYGQNGEYCNKRMSIIRKAAMTNAEDQYAIIMAQSAVIALEASLEIIGYDYFTGKWADGGEKRLISKDDVERNCVEYITGADGGSLTMTDIIKRLISAMRPASGEYPLCPDYARHCIEDSISRGRLNIDENGLISLPGMKAETDCKTQAGSNTVRKESAEKEPYYTGVCDDTPVLTIRNGKAVNPEILGKK